MAFWLKRVAEKLNADYFREAAARELDKKGEWPVFGTKLATVERKMAVRIAKRVGHEIEKKGSSKETPYRVLDFGCGPGTTLRGLKQQFGDRVKTVGLVAERTIGCKYGGVDEIIEGMHNLDGKYDFVFSYIGTTAYYPNKAVAITKAIELLDSGGIAALDIGIRVKQAELDEIRGVLARNGIRHFRITKRKSKKYPRLDEVYYLFFKKPAQRPEK